MAVLGESRVIGAPVMEAKVTEPAIRQIQMYFLAQPALGPNAIAIAYDQHADHQLWTDGGTTYMAIEILEMLAAFR